MRKKRDQDRGHETEWKRKIWSLIIWALDKSVSHSVEKPISYYEPHFSHLQNGNKHIHLGEFLEIELKMMAMQWTPLLDGGQARGGSCEVKTP